MPSPSEDVAITAAALGDPDALPLTDEEMDRLIPRRGQGRPVVVAAKVATSVLLDPRVLAAFKAAGPGWQARINDALVEWADAHGMLGGR
ncbi:BrnA antitoxin family protein [Rugamonas sp. DEMB1]|uniref:BrnA antitoxin family protein n=1 Tax=Rugamonas sp. DEMB1 TaxID=3039386 RepID=UPI002448CBAC|nr:BrnA antitoxin family protein [Rugamonas sp. DEMB1]WGG49101.1 BrnA antitoxin family protein [Rugamonas sp. DEMB1]